MGTSVKLAVAILAATSLSVAFTEGAGATTKKSHTTTTKAKKKAAPAKGIGVTHVVLNEEKQYEAVKLVAVIDPAQPGNQYLTAAPDTHLVAVEIQVTGRSSGNDTNDANDNLSIVGSNKQVYTANFDAVSECTNFASGQYTVTKGQSEVGCVTFQVPDFVQVSTVKYNPNAGFSTNEATWSLKPPG